MYSILLLFTHDPCRERAYAADCVNVDLAKISERKVNVYSNNIGII